MPLSVLLSPPAPPTAPFKAKVVPELTLNVPPTASVVVRLLVTSAVVCSVPPAKAMPPLALPRLPSLAIDSVPALMVVPPM